MIGHRLVALFATALAAVLVYGVHASAYPTTDLPALVRENLPELGFDSAVTGVLLAFRAYDTLLEIAVLLIACTGATLPRRARSASPAPELRDPVVDGLLRLLVPLLVLVSAWLLWAGKTLPGGAFQAGAVLAGTGVLLTLAGGRPPADAAHGAVRALLVVGLGLFLFVGAAVVPFGAAWLGYPPGAAGTLVLLIESVLTLSIGATLYTLYASAPGHPWTAAASGRGHDPLDDLERVALERRSPP